MRIKAYGVHNVERQQKKIDDHIAHIAHKSHPPPAPRPPPPAPCPRLVGHVGNSFSIAHIAHMSWLRGCVSWLRGWLRGRSRGHSPHCPPRRMLLARGPPRRGAVRLMDGGGRAEGRPVIVMVGSQEKFFYFLTNSYHLLPYSPQTTNLTQRCLT
jgi:hypothetical protein